MGAQDELRVLRGSSLGVSCDLTLSGYDEVDASEVSADGGDSGAGSDEGHKVKLPR